MSFTNPNASGSLNPNIAPESTVIALTWWSSEQKVADVPDHS
jgi:hypothetical protein